MALTIADVSHYQGLIDWTKFNKDGVMIKCGGGDAGFYIDSQYCNNKAGARKKGLVRGFYYFAGKGDSTKEANYFCSIITDLQKGELLALDAESGQSDQWQKTFCDTVFKITGVKPLVYPNPGKLCLAGNYGWWASRYGLNTGTIPIFYKPKNAFYPFWVMWQYTSRGTCGGIKGNVDLSTFNCDVPTLRKYGK